MPGTPSTPQSQGCTWVTDVTWSPPWAFDWGLPLSKRFFRLTANGVDFPEETSGHRFRKSMPLEVLYLRDHFSTKTSDRVLIHCGILRPPREGTGLQERILWEARFYLSVEQNCWGVEGVVRSEKEGKKIFCGHRDQNLSQQKMQTQTGNGHLAIP